MYSAPAMGAASEAAAAKKTMIPVIASVLCLGIVLFLIAATVILALIPIYISNNSVQASSSATQSKESTVQMNLDSSSGRRQATANSTDSLAGGAVDDDGKKTFQTQMTNSLTGLARSVTVSSAMIMYASSRRRRFDFLTKRQSTLVMVIVFIVFYLFSCFSACQLANEATYQSKISSALANFDAGSLIIVLNGVSYRHRIRCRAVYYISRIVGGRSSSSASVPGRLSASTAPTATGASG